MRSWLIATVLLSADASKCITEHFIAVSQHTKGTCVTKEHLEPQGKPAMDIVVKMNFSSSFDVDEFNMVQSVEASTYVYNQTMPVTMDQIMNWQEGTITQRISYAGQDPTCKVMKLPSWMAIGGARLKRLMRVGMKAMEKAYTCKGSSNGMDTYTLDFPPSWLPLPLPVEIHMSIEVDQDLLVHTEMVKEDIDRKGNKMHLESILVADETSAGGPTVDDMVVPDSWGSCEEHVLDIEEMLKPTDARTMRAVGDFRKILHAMRSLEWGEHSEIVV